MRAGNFVTIPNQAVDEKGNIAVPYAGEIPAKGRTPVEIQNVIVNRLKDRALEPQVVVSLATQNTSLVSVLGDVRQASRFPASPSGERILDAIARAGGPVTQGYDMWVSLERSGHRASVPFGALMYEPANNIYVLPNDVIYLFSLPQTFVAFGAAGTQGQFKFEAWRISLAEAVAKQGGLIDGQADPGSVFLYRGETREVAREMGIDVNQFRGSDRSCDLLGEPARSLRLLPRADLRDAEQGCHLHIQRRCGRNHEVLELPANDYGDRERSDHLRDQWLCPEGRNCGNGEYYHRHHDADANYDSCSRDALISATVLDPNLNRVLVRCHNSHPASDQQEPIWDLILHLRFKYINCR